MVCNQLKIFLAITLIAVNIPEVGWTRSERMKEISRRIHLRKL